jgi:TPR repeat protein
LGIGVDKNESEGLKWIRLAVDQGDPDGQRCLGYAYHFGLGIPKDEAKASEAFENAIKMLSPRAKGGDAVAQLNLGNMYDLDP